MNYVRSNKLNLKYLRLTPSSYKDTGIRKFDFVAKTQFFSELDTLTPIFKNSQSLTYLCLPSAAKIYLAIVIEKQGIGEMKNDNYFGKKT